jgi:hypothetical protein
MGSYSDPLRGKQQGLGTKLSHAKNRSRPSCDCAWPPRHNPDWRGADYCHPTPKNGWFPRGPELKPGTTLTGGIKSTGDATAQPLSQAREQPLTPCSSTW